MSAHHHLRFDNTALFLDLDGTLIELAAAPDAVRVPAGLPTLLRTLSQRLSGALAVVSGRPLTQIDQLLAPDRFAAAGVHGQERRDAAGALHALAHDADWREPAAMRLRAWISDKPGLLLEDKAVSLALHYRGAPQWADSCVRQLQLIASSSDLPLHLLHGKMVVELMPAGWNKGRAIAAFLSEPPFGGRLPAFLGDDVTDEAGFAEVNRRGGCSIRIGETGQSQAQYQLPDVAATARWLHGFLDTGAADVHTLRRRMPS